MDWPRGAFRRSVLEQIRVNQARTPAERWQAFCELMDAARALAPNSDEARQARQRVLETRARERERFREFLRKHIAAQRPAADECD